MIPFRSDQFDHFNNGQPVHRHVLMFPQQQQQQHLVQPAQLMYHTQVHNFPQPYPGNIPMHQQQQQQQQPLLTFVHTRPHSQQSWIMPSPPMPPPPPAFIPAPLTTFHHIQTQQPSFISSGSGIPQPSFSGGTGTSPTSFNNAPNSLQLSFGSGSGIPQPSFSGGTAFLKRKSHYLEESDSESPPQFHNENMKELPSLMNIPRQPYASNHQQHQQFRPNNPRSRFPPPRESLNVHLPNSNWNNSSDCQTYPMPSQMPQISHNDQQILTSQLFQKHQLISIDTLLKEPGRSQRSSQIIIFMRGLPGSGKSYVADLIKNEEELQSKGTNKPKIFSIDSYFITENQRETKDPKTGKITKTTLMEYEYDAKMEETYRKSLIKQVRKSIDDRFYPFLMVDQNNEQIAHFRDMADYAEANQFKVYFVELNNDLNSCIQRNIHKRSSDDIKQIQTRWEQLPLRYEILDIRSLLQSDAIEEVEMDDAPPVIPNEENEIEEEEEESQIVWMVYINVVIHHQNQHHHQLKNV
ncbi:hypothetical protein I4U23_008662 [Adineta vaga]|nr:hypothetical protein I4U23_008662 [Adineta vaga]